MFKAVAARLFIGFLMTAFFTKAGIRLADFVATKAFGATDTLYLQWTVGIILASLGLLATFYNVKDTHFRRQTLSR